MSKEEKEGRMGKKSKWDDEYRREYQRKYWEENRERLLEYQKTYRMKKKKGENA